MSSNVSQFQSPFLVTSRRFPQNPVELEPVLSKAYIDIANVVNLKTNGIYDKLQIVTANLYYSNSTDATKLSRKRQSYRQIYTFGAIAAGASITIAHGITGIIEIVNLYGNCITDVSVMALATAKYEPIPFVSTTDVTQQVSLWMDDTNITVTNGAGNNNILSGTIVVEYLLS